MNKLILFSVLSVFLMTKSAAAQESDSLSVQDSVSQYIIKETLGGKFDFSKVMEKERKQLFLIGGVAYNRKDAAIYLWGAAVKKAGIANQEKALRLYQSIIKRELTTPEANALKNGFARNTNK